MIFRPKVQRIVDGDTVELSNGDVIRVYGIDAPEKSQVGAQAATEALSSLCLGRRVRVEAKAKSWGRVVGKLMVRRFLFWEFDVAHALIKWGYVHVDPRYCTDEYYFALERKAKKRRRGVHRGRQEKPWAYRRKREGRR